MLILTLDDQPLDEIAAISEWQAVEFACLPPEGAQLELLVGDTVLEPFLRPGVAGWRWRWNAQNAVGQHRLQLTASWPDGQLETRQLGLEVRSRKVDAEQYALLLEELETAAWSVVHALRGPTVGASVGQLGQPEAAEALATLFGERFETFARAVERLGHRPPSRLRDTTEQVEPGQARDFSRAGSTGLWTIDGGGTVNDTVPADGTAAPDSAHRLPSIVHRLASIAQPGSVPSYATYENGLLVRLLGMLSRRAAELAGLPRLGPGAITRLREVRQRLVALRAMPALTGVPPLASFQGPSALMQRDPDQRTVYRMWQSLRRLPRLALESPLFMLPVQELPRLYECWCAIALAKALLELPGWRVAEQSLMTASEGEVWVFNLAEDRPLLELVSDDGRQMRLHYQPRYRPFADSQSSRVNRRASIGSLDRHTRIPDLAIEVERAEGLPALLIFDAKYRIDASGGLPEEALADAYVYLGSIGHVSGGKAVQCAWLLYPGQGREIDYPSGVGALPLLPGGADLGAWLKTLLAEVDAF